MEDNDGAYVPKEAARLLTAGPNRGWGFEEPRHKPEGIPPTTEQGRQVLTARPPTGPWGVRGTRATRKLIPLTPTKQTRSLPAGPPRRLGGSKGPSPIKGEFENE